MSEYFFDMDGSDLLGGLMSYANQNAYQDCKFTADEVSFTNDSHDRATVHVTMQVEIFRVKLQLQLENMMENGI